MDDRPKIVACEVLRDEIERVNPGLEIEFIDGALHDYPDRLRAALQEKIDATPGEREILLCCGRCSNGTVGLEARCHRLVVPAADDCISLLLGSRRRYLDEHRGCPGTFYYTRGWIDFIDDPYKDYLKIVPKYGEEKAAALARMILANYTRIAVIDTGVVELETLLPYVEMVSAFYGLPIEHLEGSLRYLDKLVNGPHDEEFLVVEPGERLEEPRFWALESL
ncbi:MAG TPA: DUF1638 domain-containing protein [Thermoleophilia bacterium]|nr:DUF1638 domain-containing protein [Thermoleophilia bacterium]